MTTSNTPDQRIDDLLRNFAKRVEQIPHGKTYGWSDEKQELKSLFETMCLEVVGDNQHSEHKEWDCPCGATHSFTEEWHATNRLRDEQRKKLASIFGKEMHNDN